MDSSLLSATEDLSCKFLEGGGRGWDVIDKVACVRTRSAANYLIRSTVDISNPRQQGHICECLSAASGIIRSDIINGLGAREDRGGVNHAMSPEMATGAFPVSEEKN